MVEISFLDFQHALNIRADNKWSRRKYNLVRRQLPLLAGPCAFCQKGQDALYHFVLDLCAKCAKPFPERGVRLIRIKSYRWWEGRFGTCGLCKRLEKRIYQFNPAGCKTCLNRFFDPRKLRTRETEGFGY